MIMEDHIILVMPLVGNGGLRLRMLISRYEIVPAFEKGIIKA